MDKITVDREIEFDSMDKIIEALKGDDYERKTLCLKAIDSLCEDRID